MKVLIVEDDQDLAQVISEATQKWGCRTLVASTGAEARRLMASEAGFKLVLLDLILPDMMGFELISEFKQIDSRLALVTMTGQNSRELEAEVRRRGACYFMEKPFNLSELKTIVDHIAKRFDAGAEAQSKNASLQVVG